MTKSSRLASTLAAAAAIWLTAGCDVATDPLNYEDFVKAEGEGEFGIWVHSGLYNRTYFLHTPPDMTDDRLYPLLIFLHGAGDTGERFSNRLRATAQTDAAGFISVYPDGLQGTWTVGCDDCTQAEAMKADDVTFLRTLTRHLAQHLPVDTTKVFLAGYSQGGSLAHLYACTSDYAPAGMVAVASLVYRNVEAECQPAGDFPVAIVHGTADVVAYYSGFGLQAPLLSVPQGVDMWVREKACNAAPTVSEIPDQAGDFTTVTSFLFTGCVGGSTVLHHRVNEGGHTWPGPTGPWGILAGRNSQNLDVTRELIRIFSDVLSGH